MSEEESPEKGSSDLLSEGPGLRGSVGTGVSQVLLLHLLQVPAGAFIGLIVLPVICVTQLFYVIPALIVAWRKGHKDTAKGIIIAASLTALLNIACTGLVFKFVEFAGLFLGGFGSSADR